jgi:hypothetical protein
MTIFPHDMHGAVPGFQPESRRRLRLLNISAELVLGILRGMRPDESGMVRVPVLDPNGDEIPPKCEIDAIRGDEWGRVFGFRLVDESWGPLVEGAAIPELNPCFHSYIVSERLLKMAASGRIEEIGKRLAVLALRRFIPPIGDAANIEREGKYLPPGYKPKQLLEELEDLAEELAPFRDQLAAEAASLPGSHKVQFEPDGIPVVPMPKEMAEVTLIGGPRDGDSVAIDATLFDARVFRAAAFGEIAEYMRRGKNWYFSRLLGLDSKGKTYPMAHDDIPAMFDRSGKLTQQAHHLAKERGRIMCAACHDGEELEDDDRKEAFICNTCWRSWRDGEYLVVPRCAECEDGLFQQTSLMFFNWTCPTCGRSWNDGAYQPVLTLPKNAEKSEASDPLEKLAADVIHKKYPDVKASLKVPTAHPEKWTPGNKWL